MRKLFIIFIALTLGAGLKWVTGKDKSPLQGRYLFNLPGFVADYFDPMPVAEENPLTYEGVALGRRLFYEKRLSKDNTISCASCHKQEFAFADSARFSPGVADRTGTMNTMPIFNLGWGRKFFWDGRASSLEEQVTDPVTNPREMAATWSGILQKLNGDERYRKAFNAVFGPGSIDSQKVVMAIAQFQRTIVSFNTRFDKYYFEGEADALTVQEERGLDLFFGVGRCNHCHSDVLLTDNYFRNNGLDELPAPGLYNTTKKESDRGRVKVPSLRNIALTAPYMHDGRFATLEEVLDFYSTGIHQKSPNIDEHINPLGIGLRLTSAQKEDLIAFLHTLTDSSFISNPDYSDPGD